MSATTDTFEMMIAIQNGILVHTRQKIETQIAFIRSNHPDNEQEISVLQARIDDINYLINTKKDLKISFLNKVTFSNGCIFNKKLFSKIEKNKINEIIEAFSLTNDAIEELNKQADIIERIQPLINKK